MENYNYVLDLPFTKTKLKFREINTNEQFALAKANLSFPNDKNSLFEYNNYVHDLLLNCISNKEDFKKINIIEYVLFITKLRTISIGNTIEFLLNNESKVKTKIQIDLREYLSNLYKASLVFEKEKDRTIVETVKGNTVKIKLNWPNLNSLPFFFELASKKSNEIEIINYSLQEFIETVELGNQVADCTQYTPKERTKMLDILPASIKLKIQEIVLNALKTLINYDVFSVSYFKDQKFNFYSLSFVEHIKMFFSNDVKSLHQEIFYLSSYGLPPSYVMEISALERKIYISIIDEQRKKQEDNSNENLPISNVSQSVKDLALEFGDIAP
jgi:hypothetical protein